MSETLLPSFQPLDSLTSEFNAQQYMIRALMSKLCTATLVQVVKVTSAGADAVAGTVDLQPLVNQIDATGTGAPLAVVYQVPYFRLQGGANAVIIDPQVNDIGIAIFASRDISAVIQSGKQSNPTCFRQYDMSDALYLGGVLNGVPAQFVQFNSSGITITTTNAITVNAATATINATTSATIKSPIISLENAGTALKKLVNDTFIALFNSHVHTTVTGLGTPTPPTILATAANATSVTQAE
jgi:hypothetical protein